MQSIGKVAEETGLSIVAIRHYEKIGLIQSARLENGYRQYSDAEVAKLKLIKKAKQLGFSLNEIEELLKLEGMDAKGHDVKWVLHQKLLRIEEQLHFLQDLKKTYQQLLQSCHGNMPVQDCPIMQSLKK